VRSIRWLSERIARTAGKPADYIEQSPWWFLADALRRLASDSALAERLSAGGLAAYRERASEAVLGPRWRGLLESLL